MKALASKWQNVKKVVAFYDTVIEKSIKLLVEVYLREAPHVDIIEN